MGRLVMGALLLVACGKVADVQQQDASRAPLLDAFECPASMQQCGATCVDLTTDPMNCGACGAACGSGVACVAGNCTDQQSSCAERLFVDPSTTTGAYTDTATGHVYYCDMSTTPPTEYDGIGIGEYDTAFANYALITPTALGPANAQAAFIGLFNAQGGAKLLAPFTPGNCCMKYDTTTTNYLAFNGTPPFAGPAGGSVQCGSQYTSPLYSFALNELALATLPLPANFFVTNVPGTSTACSTMTNSALFWEVRQ